MSKSPHHKTSKTPQSKSRPRPVTQTAAKRQTKARAKHAHAPHEATALRDQVLADFATLRIPLSAEDFDLLVYLVASHHGKVRVALHSVPKDQDYHDRDQLGLPIRGVREGDILPVISIVDGEPALPEISLTLEPACVGLSRRTGRSWRERTLGLQEQWGACGLAFLEAIFVAADRRASKLNTPDPALVQETRP